MANLINDYQFNYQLKPTNYQSDKQLTNFVND